MVEISEVKKIVDEGLEKLNSLMEEVGQTREKLRKEFERVMENSFFGKYDKEQFKEFLKEPYVIIPKRENEFYIIAPKWIDFQIGWLERQTKSFNIFIVNRYMQWIAQIPETLQTKLQFPKPLPIKYLDGVVFTGKQYQDEVLQKYKPFLWQRVGEDRVSVKKGYEFKFLAQMIEDGILPFMPKPIAKEDLREWQGLELRNYQKIGWTEFLEKGACGIYWAFGSGKSLFGIYALARILGKKLVVVPTLTLKEQWEERLYKYIPQFRDETEVVTYHAYDKLKGNEYSLIVFDECQHLPANTFIRLSTLKTKYRLGFSGSPFREDRRENYIFALTGFPIGMSWDELIQLQVVRQPTFKLYLVNDLRNKYEKMEELLKLPLKTIIFCDSIELGEKISKRFEIPFVFGETRERLDIIRQAQTCVVSRVGDEGLSLPDLERVIEVAFLYGSRMQESQRFGRLMHSTKEEPEHIIIMTEEEFENYQKRLYAITERGFKIEIVR